MPTSAVTGTKQVHSSDKDSKSSKSGSKVAKTVQDSEGNGQVRQRTGVDDKGRQVVEELHGKVWEVIEVRDAD